MKSRHRFQYRRRSRDQASAGVVPDSESDSDHRPARRHAARLAVSSGVKWSTRSQVINPHVPQLHSSSRLGLTDAGPPHSRQQNPRNLGQSEVSRDRNPIPVAINSSPTITIE